MNTRHETCAKNGIEKDYILGARITDNPAHRRAVLAVIRGVGPTAGGGDGGGLCHAAQPVSGTGIFFQSGLCVTGTECNFNVLRRNSVLLHMKRFISCSNVLICNCVQNLLLCGADVIPYSAG